MKFDRTSRCLAEEGSIRSLARPKRPLTITNPLLYNDVDLIVHFRLDTIYKSLGVRILINIDNLPARVGVKVETWDDVGLGSRRRRLRVEAQEEREKTELTSASTFLEQTQVF